LASCTPATAATVEFIDVVPSGDYDSFVKSDRHHYRSQATKVFLSYSPEDAKVARALASRLAEAGFETWDPAESLFPGDNWALRIGQALQESDAMVVLVSPNSMKSEFVRQELEYALGSARYKGRLVPVVLKPTKDMPWILKRFPSVRIGTNFEAAADQIAQHLKDGFELAPAAA
jgi:hypothetical protein